MPSRHCRQESVKLDVPFGTKAMLLSGCGYRCDYQLPMRGYK
jgi:hypothetical protein